jgi:DNA-binding sugar fermentation-stimulating protein
MVGSGRCSLHNAVVRQVVADASFDMLNPVRECQAFSYNSRIDILIRTGRELLVAVACSPALSRPAVFTF